MRHAGRGTTYIGYDPMAFNVVLESFGAQGVLTKILFSKLCSFYT